MSPNPFAMMSHRPRRRSYASPLSALALALALALPAHGQMMGPHQSPQTPANPLPAGPVTAWSAAADLLAGGTVNWRTLAIMHIAMHDALNTAKPRYALMMPPVPEAVPGAPPALAMAAAAYQVLLARHPEQAGAVGDPLFRAAVAATPPGQASDDAVTMGAAIGLAAVSRYRASMNPPVPFPVSQEPGRWRATPPFRLVALVGDSKPFLFDDPGALQGPAPPVPGSPEYLAVVEEVRRLGDDRSRERTAEQTAAAEFWAMQSSQRGYLHLAIRLMAEHPLPGGLWDEARGLAQLTMALADGYVTAWELKRRYGYWRPITAINEGGFGVTPDARWYPLLPTPPHPEHPSGHATDCAVGATVLRGVFGPAVGAIRYTAVDIPGQPARDFPSFDASAEECAASRVWAGAHFRTANDEGLRLGRLIAARALEALPPLPAAR